MKNKCEDFIAAKEWYKIAKEQDNKLAIEILESKFPELKECKESEDEKIRKGIIKSIMDLNTDWLELHGVTRENAVAWLKKQGEQETSCDKCRKEQPSHSCQDITALGRCAAEHEQKPADKVEPKFKHGDRVRNKKSGLEQTLGSCIEDVYEGAFPFRIKDQDDWGLFEQKSAENQGEQKYIPKYKIGDYIKNTNYKGEPIYEIVYVDKECYICEYRGKERMGDKTVMHFSFDNPYLHLVQNPTDKVEPKFKVGDFIVNDYCMGRVIEITNDAYLLDTEQGIPLSHEHNVHLWTIQDAKDGDVLANDNEIVIFKENNYNPKDLSGCMFVYCAFFNKCGYWYEIGGINPIYYKPATKEQRDLLFQKMKEAGYEWDAEKKELKEIVQKSTVWSEEDERMYRGLHNLIYSTPYCDSRKEFSDWFKSLKNRVGCEVNCTTTKEWSDEDGKMLDEFIKYCEYSIAYNGKDSEHAKTWEKRKSWLKSIKDRVGNFDDGYKVGFSAAKHNQWKPSEEEIGALEHLIDSAISSHTFILKELVKQLKKL